ncbi:hypothetical protein NM688_g1985 [Phlebia brevispora]|uniref:Uncharacterized protein n=1 Tax=Phlebia brevispora TaxID=194682 RepID=A0ACC1TA52_9APHY|nr:hypothetical protein NM688_g1985 [Phlebia brevispora]
MDGENDAPLTFNQTVRGITEFIEVAIHTILYVRQIYPAELFVRRKKYNTPVFQSRHPALNEYISGAVRAIGEELTSGNVDKVVIIIKTKDDVALERFVFAVENMIQVEAFNKDTSVEGAMTPIVLGQYFRSFLVKLCMIETQLGHLCLGDDVTFGVVLELQDDKAPSVSNGKDPPPWVPSTPQHATAGVTNKAELHMLRAVDTGVINLSFAVQESEQKLVMMGRKADIKGKQRAK